jgi:hypothetical protein
MEYSCESGLVAVHAMKRTNNWGQSVDPAPAPAPRELSEPHVEHRELLARIIVSPTFVRSEKLSSLLSYICEMKMKGRENEINEQKIGQAVFGRSRDYDSTVDGIVRTQASRLRNRLDLYFRNEGTTEKIRIVVPRGGYVPVFEPHAEKTVQPEPDSAPEGPAPNVALPATGQGRSGNTGLHFLPWVFTVLLSVALLAAIFIQRGVLSISPLGRPPIHPLWSRMFSPDQSTLLIPGDSGLVLFGNFAKQYVTLDDYIKGEYRTLPAAASTAQQAMQTDLANRRYTSIVDLQIAQSLNRLALADRSRLQVRYARDLRPNDLKSGNAILIGAAEANPWVELYERNMNFVFSDNYGTRVFSVLNRSPHQGEPLRWESSLTDPQHHVYGVVAFLPNLADNGNTLILEGTSMAGTESSWDFVSDDSQLLPFLDRICRSDGSLPHFELILETNNMGSSAVRSTVLAWRIIG